MPLRLYNTLTRTQELFEPLERGKVRMYNCGPTVYSYAHIGNFASFLMADLLRRYLEYSGYEVAQIMNITDVGHLTEDDVADATGEDKLEKTAREEKKDPYEIARFYEEAFHEDRRALNLLPAHHYPRATEHIPDMIRMIEDLERQGIAYVAAGQVYYAIDRFPYYGRLSGNTVEELLAGHRVEPDPAKRNPLDFTLWKKDPKHLMQWDSPWGRGFPGWHIECSAMSARYLGERFDIHTGGEDNIFPHHECEIAQSWKGGGEEDVFARFWIHRRHILVDRKKMSKSLGNFYTIRDLRRRGFTGLEVRYALLSAHYRTNLNFTLGGVAAAREALRKLRQFRINMEHLPEVRPAAGEVEAVRRLGEAADLRFRAALDDDLNISGALAEVHTFVTESHKQARSRAAGRVAVERLLGWDRVLGVMEPQWPEADRAAAGGDGLTDEEIEALVARRQEARARRDYAEADRIREELAARGVALQDGPAGTVWQREVRGAEG